jgi:hypothetical protein
LALAHEVRVERQWSTAELERASDIDDGRIRRALEHAGEFGVAQYLTAAPDLFKLWQDNRGSAPEGQPRGVALVAAAVDTRRAGYHRGIALDVLRKLHEFYLGENKAHIRLEAWDEALRWATRPLYSTSSLLMPDGEDKYIAFDYLGDAIDAGPVRELPSGVWDELISFVPAEDIMEIAWSAFYRNRPLIAEMALQKAFSAGHYEAALDFAYMMGQATERVDDVVAWLDRAIKRTGGASIPPEQVLELRDQMAWWVGARWAGSGDPARARQLAQGVVDDSTRLLGQEHPQTLTSRLTLARQVGELGDHDTALAIATDVAGIAARADDDLGIRSAARFEVAVWTRSAGDPCAAVALWQDLVAESVGAQDPDIIDSILNIAATVDGLGDPELDNQVLGWLAELFDQLSGREARADLYIELGWILAWWVGGRDEGEGDHAAARDIAQHVIDTGTEAFGPNNPHVLNARRILANQLGRLGDGERALAISREIAETSTRIYGPAHRVTIAAKEEVHRWKPDPA